ncbi:hypothetical protein [Candidatus Poriferisodalis sp.]|uniref:hypothetical protein n=1 Tax=Candidatus Poriferisodalis sp. TaxID=3101277 RepID=UPI003B5B4CF9
MTKRTLAALAALLAFMAVLVAVPLATSETAEAHTKTVKRCSYDPFTNVQQCWTETVAHTHRVIPDNPPPDTSPKPEKCPTGTTGTPPNCSPIPPTNDPAPDPEDKECPAGTVGTPPNCETQPPPKCPAGQTGTWPNCKTPPKTCPAGQHSNGGAGKNCHSHSFTPPHCGTGTWSPGHGHTPVPLKPCPPPPKCPTGWTGTPPDCRIIQTVCPDGYSGTPPDCVKDVCPDGQTGTPPNCKKVEPPKCADGYSGSPPNCVKECATGNHPHGTTCHLDHDWSKIPCGTGSDIGTWAPHAGHTPRQRPQCGRENNDCSLSHPGLRFQHRHVMGANKNRGGGTMSSCHIASTSHCQGGQHEHVHGSQECHALGTAVENSTGTHSGWTDHCPTGQHSHEHSGSCHTATSEPAECAENYTYSYSTQKCELDTALRIFQRGTNLYIEGTGQVICTVVPGGAATKAANLILKGSSKVAKWIFKQTVEIALDHPCDQLWDEYQEHIKKELEFDPEQIEPEDADGDDASGDDESDSDADDDDSSDDDSGSDEDEDPEPTPGICDRDTSPTNPYKIGPSNTTPQQWADWWAWFDCP